MGLQACNVTKKRLHRRFPMNIVNFNNTNFEKHLRTAGSLSSYILHRKLNKIIQEADWPSRLAFCFFWNIKSLYFTYSHPYSLVLSLAVIRCYLLLLFAKEAVAQTSSVKKVFLEISQNSQENTCARVSFLKKLQTMACNFIKKRLWHKCFPVNFAKFLRTPFLTEHLWWLLLLLLVVICCHKLSLAVSLVVTRFTTRCHSLSLIVIPFHSMYHLPVFL